MSQTIGTFITTGNGGNVPSHPAAQSAAALIRQYGSQFGGPDARGLLIATAETPAGNTANMTQIAIVAAAGAIIGGLAGRYLFPKRR